MLVRAMIRGGRSILAATMNVSRPRVLLPFALLLAILAVSTASIFIRFAQRDVPSPVVAALRLTIATAVLAPVALVRYRPALSALTLRSRLSAGLSGIFLAIHFATWISSLEYTTVASSVVFVSTGPMWVALLSPALLNERVRTATLLGLVLAILGSAVVALSGACVWNAGLECMDLAAVIRGQAMWGNLLALIGAWAVAGYLIVGRKLRAGLSLIPYIFLVYGVAACVLLLIMVAAGDSPFGHPGEAYVWIFLLAVVPQLIGHTAYNWALGYAPATFVATATLGEPIGSAALAYFVLDESPGLGVVAGGFLILCGLVLATRSTRPDSGHAGKV